jgi:hypothetical protein
MTSLRRTCNLSGNRQADRKSDSTSLVTRCEPETGSRPPKTILDQVPAPWEYISGWGNVRDRIVPIA